MNLMYYVFNDETLETDDKYFINQLNILKEKASKGKIKVAKKYKKIRNSLYFLNGLPLIDKTRDVLSKSFKVCKMRINWKDIAIDDPAKINELLPEQYGWNISVVDKEHTRNNYQNKETYWIVFDKKEKAEQALEDFNMMFRTAIEQDCIDEYKHYKQNPAKRILTFNNIIHNAYDLYDLVDKGLV
jgi:hypothetical protein